MMKYPWTKFYPSDWLSDTAALCPGARGIWIDWICHMHLTSTGGVSGTVERLARIARCSTSEAALAITEIASTGVGDVTKANGVVTVICRRMKRDANNREATRLRVMKHRGNATVTPQKLEARVQSPPTPHALKGSEAGIPTLAEVLLDADMKGLPEASARAFFDHHQNNQLWLNQFSRLIDWRRKLLTWAANDREPSSSISTKGTNHHASNSAASKQPRPDRNAGTYNEPGASATSVSDYERKVR